MTTNAPLELLQAYAKERSEKAFSTLVSRYIELVYSVATRQVDGDSHLAQDITQTVFSDLARKAGSLPKNTQLGGWLHRHTCFVSSNLRRSQMRRLNRERIAVQIESLTGTEDKTWEELAPELDIAINQLNERDRSAIVMRFFEQKNHREIGLALSTSEATAQKRVTRAIDKLRVILAQQGVTLSGPILALLIENKCLASPPEGLAIKVSRSTQLRVTRAATHSATTPPQMVQSFLKISAYLAVGLTAIVLIIFQGNENLMTTANNNKSEFVPLTPQSRGISSERVVRVCYV